MKIFIFILIISAELLSYSSVKAVVNARDIDLYRLPFETSQKRASYYKRGTLLHVRACNRYGWCKVKHGYVKKHLLKFYNLNRNRYKKLPKYRVVKKKIVYPNEVIDVNLYEPKKEKVKTKTVALLKEDANLTKMALPYDIYFSNRSSYLNIKESD